MGGLKSDVCPFDGLCTMFGMRPGFVSLLVSAPARAECRSVSGMIVLYALRTFASVQLQSA